ncbi:Uncharacterised protein [[Clostridium] sordellii]|uniref:hypothetical protein n=1 Tax=Paraclostridium sordellii TaxID=1505 RepID=UPI000541AADC|nr:hypothetical protein [Paeniclostridium sordellii]CEK33252.1 hypothetical protein UMC2_05021 [[Clostridium] sordellii] [Paeniclostridium sordellii]CEQ09712.1 Uncharacterised protein [[Clostridium] sordellii] [Paeniclostridium sordellii]
MDNKSIVELKSELIEMIDDIEDKETLEEVFILSCIVKIIEINRDANFEFIKNKLREIENIDVSDEKIIELYKSWKDLEKKYNS